MDLGLTDVDITKIKLTGNEKRFNELRSNFYKTLENAETFKQREFLEKRDKYTHFLKNLNRSQYQVPKSSERIQEKDDMYDLILNDKAPNKLLTEDYKREQVLQLKRELRGNLKKMAEPDDPLHYEDKYRQRLLGYHLNSSRDDENTISKKSKPPKGNLITTGSQMETINEQAYDTLNSQQPGIMKKLENQRIKMQIGNIRSKNYSFDNLDSFPTEIDDIVNIKEYSNPLGTIKEVSPVCENLRKNGLIEHSILKQNYFYLDESQDINFFKDLSSYSRTVFKDPKKDMVSLDIFDHKDLNFGSKINDLSDEDMLNITSNHISEAILRSSLSNNKKFEDQILTYEAKIVNDEFVLSLMPKKENNFKRIIKESKGSQTGNDVKINTHEYNKKKDMTIILNTILKLKNLKSPLEKLPESAITIKKMKREVNEKIIHNLKTMAKLITGKNNLEFGEMIRHLMENMSDYKNQYCEGIPKLRLIKLLLIELAELKKEDEQKIVNGELPPLLPAKNSNDSSFGNVLQPSRDSTNQNSKGNNSQSGRKQSTNRVSNRSYLARGGLDEIPEDHKDDMSSKGNAKVPALNIKSLLGRASRGKR